MINISKYRRPDVYIEEIDNSIIDQIITEGIINLVPGFSKKGQFNRPILLKKKSDALSIIGPIDRNLEKKGSYGHRTVYKMLESGPVYFLNLLKTDDTLDVIQYQSISTSAITVNDIERTQSYRRFFNTSGFWERSPESFLNFATYNSLLHFTNMSDRKVTVFAFKSSQPGFNLTVADWYVGTPADQIPTFLRPTDLISDYMLHVIVVSGDWSNYTQLAVDTIWGNYFNASGLRKTEINNFINNQGVTLLADYPVLSLIPYFRDASGNDIFIENNINRDTDRTGLFCAYNYDAIETDFPNAMVDLIGNSLVDTDASTLKFLSYDETISESLLYSQKNLDSAANVLANGANIGTRSHNLMNEFTNAITFGGTVAAAIPTVDIVGGVGNFYNYQGLQYTIPVATNTQTLATLVTPGIGLITRRYDAIYLDNTGIVVATGIPATAVNPTAIKPAVPAAAIVLGYCFLEVTSTPTYLNTYTPVTVDGSGFLNLSTVDLAPQVLTGINQIEFIFSGTAGNIPTNNYEVYRRVKYFNTLVSILDGPNKDKAVFITNTGNKVSLEGSTVLVDVSADKTIAVTLADVTADIRTLYVTANRRFTLYFVDDEFIVGTGAAASYAMVTKNTPATLAEGVVAKYSKMYLDYVNGKTSTKDFFYEKLVQATSTIPAPIEFKDVLGNDYIVLSTTDYGTLTGGGYGSPGDKLFIVGSTNNNKIFTITNIVAPSTVGITNANQTAFQVNENTVAEVIATNGIIDFYAANEKIYLQFFLANTTLNVNYANFDFTSEITLGALGNFAANNNILLYSYRNNYKQTLEIEQPMGYVQTINKVLINAARYSEVKVGDYLEAYVDIPSLQPGEEPKRLTRITSKRTYQPDPSLVELTCDSQIKLVSFAGDYQTTRYTNIEDYISTYKALVYNGFQVRAASMPDGTETRLIEILDIIGKGENLSKALIDKNRISWRYLVDSFGLGLQERSKQQLVDLCGDRLNVFGFINMPSMKAFKESTSPSFIDAEGNLVVEYIKLGANPTSNPAFLYTFGTGVGQSCVGYFCPYMKINDNGRPIIVPPAMFVATSYMRKFISRVAGLTPWTVIAGVNDGRIDGITDVELQYGPEDIEFLNLMGANPIVFKLGRGFNIETENTAQQIPKSSLSFIHCREVLIELENELRNMLLNFQWKFNTPETRAEIKLRADAICQRYVDRKGLFDFRNVCDETNNTSTLIDNQIGVLSTSVEISKAMAVIVNQIQILRTGAIQSGGFTAV